MIRLLADENIVGLDLLPASEVQVSTCAGRSMDPKAVAAHDVLWVRSVTSVGRALVDDTPLRFVGTATAGTEHVDQQFLQEAQIPFSAAPGSNANAVVEYVLTALLQLEEPWQRLEAGGELAIVGYGAVGQRLASVARALGWRVRVCDPYKEAQFPEEPFETFEALLDCDVISLHTSLLRDGPWPSYHLLGEAALSGLGPEQTLINAARGEVIDNGALERRLARGDAPQLVLDVWEDEPAFHLPLLKYREIRLATPHIAGYSWPAKFNATRYLWQAMEQCGLVAGSMVSPAIEEGVVWPEGVLSARAMMLACCPLERDDRAFRGLAAAPETRAAGFDAMRRSYPQRWEVAGMNGNLLPPLGDDAKRLHQVLRTA